MATKGQIEELKADWLNDPCWDLEETEGFEEHREELAAYAAEVKAGWEAAHRERMKTLAENLGIPGNMETAGFYSAMVRRAQADKERAADYLAHYMGLAGVSGGNSRAEIACLVTAIVDAAQSMMEAHVAVELAKRGAAK